MPRSRQEAAYALPARRVPRTRPRTSSRARSTRWAITVHKSALCAIFTRGDRSSAAARRLDRITAIIGSRAFRLQQDLSNEANVAGHGTSQVAAGFWPRLIQARMISAASQCPAQLAGDLARGVVSEEP